MTKQAAKIILLFFGAIFLYNKTTSAGLENDNTDLDFITGDGIRDPQSQVYILSALVLVPWSLYTLVRK